MSAVLKLTLGAQTFDIPELPLGVKRQIWPISRRMAIRSRNAKESGDDNALSEAITSEENIDDAIAMLVAGISFAKPGFKRESLDEDLDIEIEDILAGATIIAIQAGGKRTGEARAAILKNQTEASPPTPPIADSNQSPTGTESSPTSA